MRIEWIDVSKRMKRCDKKVQIPNEYLTELTNREQELIEGGGWKYIVVNGESIKIYVPEK